MYSRTSSSIRQWWTRTAVEGHNLESVALIADRRGRKGGAAAYPKGSPLFGLREARWAVLDWNSEPRARTQA